METLSLKKFQDIKLESKQMAYVNAGECTGGGGSWSRKINKYGQTVETLITWESDETNTNGHVYLYCGRVETITVTTTSFTDHF